MELRRDEHGKPVGLAWPEAPEFEAETVKRAYAKGVFSGTRWEGGRPPQELCGKGLHDMSVHGRPNSSGGRYCAPCKYKRQAVTNRAWREKKKREAQEAS